MASLYQTAANVRKIILGFLVFSVILIGYDTYQRFQIQSKESGIKALSQRRFYMEPSRVFGEIEFITVPGISGVNYYPSTFTVESIYPAFPDVAYVYQLEKPRIRSNTTEDALEVARNLGFQDLSSQLDSEIYEWFSQDKAKRLTFDLGGKKWLLKTDYVNSLDAKSSKRVLNDITSYPPLIKNIIKRLNFGTFGLPDGKVDVKLSTMDPNGNFTEVSSSAQASYVHIFVKRSIPLADLKPASLQPERLPNEKVPTPVSGYVFKKDPRRGSINFVVSNDLRNLSKDFFELEFTDFNYLPQKGAYLIVTPSEAFTNLQLGRGSLVYVGPQNSDFFENYTNIKLLRVRFDARRTELGYYEPDSYVNNGYVIPIYIFRGTAEMEDGRLATVVFYIDAIKRI
ncbi:hypothetical protein D6810_01855 [Candidatus Dojkabacteria bacterium]|uniref:Uncharacterized protein n=1 Tax=Candidatus Dojkabacteria bacterium TaxID=2099670 RepID=A0A3M0YYJ9_9BACT|nr:MAG: hypothetical protein D6810_01855 [Candidatus Dojkabacteria bacterium]